MMPLGREFCALMQQALHPRSVLEVGSKPALGQEELANLRTVFTNAVRYIGTDMEAGPGVDVVWDGTELRRRFSRQMFELGVCMDTLEHCRNPERVLWELTYVVQRVGVRVAFCAPIHMHPGDYWRMTPQLLHVLLSPQLLYGFIAQDYSVLHVPANQEYDWPHGVYGFGTPNREERDTLIQLLQQREKKDIMVVKVW